MFEEIYSLKDLVQKIVLKFSINVVLNNINQNHDKKITLFKTILSRI